MHCGVPGGCRQQELGRAAGTPAGFGKMWGEAGTPHWVHVSPSTLSLQPARLPRAVSGHATDVGMRHGARAERCSPSTHPPPPRNGDDQPDPSHLPAPPGLALTSGKACGCVCAGCTSYTHQAPQRHREAAGSRQRKSPRSRATCESSAPRRAAKERFPVPTVR